LKAKYFVSTSYDHLKFKVKHYLKACYKQTLKSNSNTCTYNIALSSKVAKVALDVKYLLLIVLGIQYATNQATYLMIKRCLSISCSALA
jgi:hypothetical protein